MRRDVRLIVFVVTVVLLAGGWLVWREYGRWQSGTLTLSSQYPVVLAEILDQHDHPVRPPFPLPAPEPLSLPAGPYRVRFTGSGLLSETYDTLVERGTRQVFQIEPRKPLWKPIAVPEAFEVFGRGIVLVSHQGLSRVDGASGEVLWSLMPDFSWDWQGQALQPPSLVRPPRDLDGDGVPDLVWACRHQAALLAVSGREGKLLWTFRPAGAGSKGATAKGTVCGAPAWHDVDRDGLPDLVVTFLHGRFWFPSKSPPRRWIEAVSGRTGESLWTHDLARDQFGRQFNVEMQMLVDRYFEKRILYYASRLHQQQLHEGDDYLNLQPTISISFLGHVLCP
jgi:hypothetical protein